MRNIDKVLELLETLSPADLDRVRRRLRQVENRIWSKERPKTSVESARSGIIDRQVRAALIRRRRAPQGHRQ